MWKMRIVVVGEMVRRSLGRETLEEREAAIIS